MTITATPNSQKKPRTFWPLVFLGIVVGVALSIARAVVWSGGSFNAEVSGYAFGGIMFSLLIAYAIAGREKARNLNLFSLSFCGICLVLYLMEVSAHPVSWKKHMGDVIRQAAGTKTATSDVPADPQTDAIVRDMFRDMLDRRKLHDTEVARFAPELERLYSAESFSSPAAIHRTLDAVSGVLAADREFSKQVKEWQERVEADVNRSSMSENDKQQFITGVRKSLGDSKILTVRQEVIETEARWADSTTDLYTFALSNPSKLAIKDSKIVITDENVREQFNRKLTDSQSIRKDLRSLNSQLKQMQLEGMQQFGVTPEDLGLKGK